MQDGEEMARVPYRGTGKVGGCKSSINHPPTQAFALLLTVAGSATPHGTPGAGQPRMSLQCSVLEDTGPGRPGREPGAMSGGHLSMVGAHQLWWPTHHVVLGLGVPGVSDGPRGLQPWLAAGVGRARPCPQQGLVSALTHVFVTRPSSKRFSEHLPGPGD